MLTSRGRRRSVPHGRIVASKEFRECRAKEGRSREEAEEAEKTKVFKKRRLDERVLADNGAAEARLAEKEKLTVKMMEAFVRARTDKPVPEKGATALSARVEELRSKPVVVRLGLEPEGYPAWLAAQLAKGDAENEPTPAEDAKPTATPAPLMEVQQTRAE